MRIRVWRQFSSNHSSHFTVVGRFESEEQAREATGRFVSVLEAIDEWRRAPENQKWIEEQEHLDGGFSTNIPLTPPEIEFSKQYDVDWGRYSIDWIAGAPSERVQQLQRDVLVSVEFETWNLPTPIKNLMKSLVVRYLSNISRGSI